MRRLWTVQKYNLTQAVRLVYLKGYYHDVLSIFISFSWLITGHCRNVVTIGLFGLTGLIAFSIGAILLWRMGFYVYELFWPLLVGEAILIILFLTIAAVLFFKSRNRPIVSGREELQGSVGNIIRVEADQGWMRLRGEIWQVRSTTPLSVGQKVVVIGRDGLVLIVSNK